MNRPAGPVFDPSDLGSEPKYCSWLFHFLCVLSDRLVGVLWSLGSAGVAKHEKSWGSCVLDGPGTRRSASNFLKSARTFTWVVIVWIRAERPARCFRGFLAAAVGRGCCESEPESVVRAGRECVNPGGELVCLWCVWKCVTADDGWAGRTEQGTMNEVTDRDG